MVTHIEDGAALEQRVERRLLWILMPGILVAFIDRANISFAAPTMNPALGIDLATFGLGTGIFFIGYMLCEIPSNLILARVGARVWISRIMISWGIVAAAAALAVGPKSFLILRFLLGVAEAGFIPGAMLYASYWVSPQRLGGFTALLLLMVPVAGSITALLSAAILSLDGQLGIAGWQWIFILEGIPAILLGFVALAVLDDKPADAAWLSDTEKRHIVEATSGGGMSRHASAWDALAALRSRPIWVLGGAYFLLNLALGSQPWLPLMLSALGLSAGGIALALAMPNLLAAAAMVLWGRHSDRANERANHLLIAAAVSAAGWLICAVADHSAAATILGISLALIGLFASVVVFWAMPASTMPAADRPVGIALITCIGLIGSFVSPVLTGQFKVLTGSYGGGMAMAAAGMLLAAWLVRRSASRRALLPAASGGPGLV